MQRDCNGSVRGRFSYVYQAALLGYLDRVLNMAHDNKLADALSFFDVAVLTSFLYFQDAQVCRFIMCRSKLSNGPIIGLSA